jgi:hypothetical protein
MSERMERAMEAAKSCWKKALEQEPGFVEAYFRHCENLLCCHTEINGDQFTKYCRRQGLVLPSGLHHNTWVSGVSAMEDAGWITKIGKVVPTEMQNHMPVVTRWKSNVTF